MGEAGVEVIESHPGIRGYTPEVDDRAIPKRLFSAQLANQ